MPGKQNKERRQAVKQDVRNSNYKTEQGILFHKGKLDKNYKEVLLEDQVKDKLRELKTREKHIPQAHEMKSVRALVRLERYQIDLVDIGKGKEALMRGHNCRYVLLEWNPFQREPKCGNLKNKEATKRWRSQMWTNKSFTFQSHKTHR